MIKNLSNKIYEVMRIMASDSGALMKIIFKNPNRVSDFANDYLSTVLNPVYYSTYSNFVIISIEDVYTTNSAVATLDDILSVAAQDYDAKKIQLTFCDCQTLLSTTWQICCTIEIDKQ